MFHFQNPVNDWPRAVAILPAGYWVKAVDNVQLLNEAKGINAGIKTVLRHHYDTGQIFGGTLVENKTRARAFFKTFIDGTFDNYAHNVDAIEEFNEYYGNTQSPQEKAAILIWIQAVNEVWTSEYRNQQKYAHIQLVSCNTAIGNDIPLDAARIVYEHDGLLGYHSYVAVDSTQAQKMIAVPESVRVYRTNMREGTLPFYTEPESAIEAVTAAGEIHVNDWLWYSGRWTAMDAQYKSSGISVNWLFTEGGPIERRPDGGLDPQNGWRHPNVYGGNVEKYVANCQYFLNNTANWNKTNNNRAGNVTLFTSGGWDSWQYFETKQPEMDVIANMAKNFVPVEPDPEPEPEPECRGLPRTQYKRNYWTVPQNATESQWLEICRQAFAEKRTVGFSYDDAGIGDLDSKTAVLYGIVDKQAYIDWFAENYPGTILEFRELPKV